jgi:hypothetical protein
MMNSWAIAFFLLANPDVSHPVKIGGFETKAACESYRAELMRRIALGSVLIEVQYYGNRCERGGRL